MLMICKTLQYLRGTDNPRISYPSIAQTDTSLSHFFSGFLPHFSFTGKPPLICKTTQTTLSLLLPGKRNRLNLSKIGVSSRSRYPLSRTHSTLPQSSNLCNLEESYWNECTVAKQGPARGCAWLHARETPHFHTTLQTRTQQQGHEASLWALYVIRTKRYKYLDYKGTKT